MNEYSLAKVQSVIYEVVHFLRYDNISIVLSTASLIVYDGLNPVASSRLLSSMARCAMLYPRRSVSVGRSNTTCVPAQSAAVCAKSFSLTSQSLLLMLYAVAFSPCIMMCSMAATASVTYV